MPDSLCYTGDKGPSFIKGVSMKMRYLLGLCLGCAGLFLVNKVQQGQEPKKKKVDLSHSFYFDFNQQELRKLVQDSWYSIERSLEEKGFIEKLEGNDNWVKAEKKMSESQEAVKEIVSLVVDQALQEDGALLIKGLDKHVLGRKKALTLFGISLKRIIFSALMELNADPILFDWCGCVPSPERITVAMNVVNDVSKNYLPKNQLRYTSIATGSLLQDYIILQELKARGFKSMKINVIDPAYYSPADLKKIKELVPLSERKQKHIDYIASFNQKHQEGVIEGDEGNLSDSLALEEFTNRLKADGSAIEVIAWENTYDYIARAKQYEKEKSDVVLLIDASSGYFEQPNYPSLANVVLISPEGKKSPILRIYLSEHDEAQLYVCDENEKDSSLYKEVSKLLTDLKEKTKGELVTELVKQFGDTEKFTMNYAIDLYALLQDMMYECIADAKKAVVYVDEGERDDYSSASESEYEGSESSESDYEDYSEIVIKIDPVAYRKQDVRKKHVLYQCEYEMQSAKHEMDEYHTEIDPIAAMRAESAKSEAIQADYAAKMAEFEAKMDEINAKYGFSNKKN
jgi:hypothetical protein